MTQVKITVRRNGPFRVEAPEGAIELVDADGNPYCDGTHSKIGFQAAEAAVKKVEETAPPQEPKPGA